MDRPPILTGRTRPGRAGDIQLGHELVHLVAGLAAEQLRQLAGTGRHRVHAEQGGVASTAERVVVVRPNVNGGGVGQRVPGVVAR
jgi:hypothetical protein